MRFLNLLLGNSDKKYNTTNWVPFDPWFIVIPAILMTIGLIAIYSASIYVSFDKFGTSTYYVNKQILFMGMGIVMYCVCINISTKLWYSLGQWKMMTLVAVMCLLVIFVGKEINGAKRWLSLGFFNVQPSEFLKISLILYLAGYIHRHNEDIKNPLRSFLVVIPTFVFLVILFFQKDLGTCVVLACILITMLVFAGIMWRTFLVYAIVGIAGAVAMIVKDPYRIQRLLSFTDPFKDITKSGYQLAASQMSLARGGMWGLGLGNSELKLSYIPEPHTDFIMSIIGEEMGFVFVSFVFILELLLIFRTVKLGLEAISSTNDRNYFHGYCAIGIGSWFAVQSIINMGVVSGLFPTKGLTMPFISYGGSSLISSILAVCILLRISYERRANYLNRIRNSQLRYKQNSKRSRYNKNVAVSGENTDANVAANG